MGMLSIAIAVFLVLLVILIAYSAMSAPAAPVVPAASAAKSAKVPPVVNVPLASPVTPPPVYQPTNNTPTFSTPSPSTSTPPASAPSPVVAPAPAPAPASVTNVATVAPNVAPVVTPATAPIVVALAPPAPLPKVIGATQKGCRDCGSGLYFCDKGIISSSEWWNGQAAQVSDYRIPLYDPSEPQVSLGDSKYYWRQGADGCPNDPKPGALVAGCTKCSSPGMYWCPKGKISSAPYGLSGAAALVSEQRYPQYDPVEPQVTLSGSKYYWRMASDSCGTY